MGERIRTVLGRRRRLWMLSLVGLAGLVVVRWNGFASAGAASASLAEVLADEVDVEAESVLWWGPESSVEYRSAIFRGFVADGQPADLYYVAARVTSDGDVLAVRGLSNLTRSSSADELSPMRIGDDHAAYAVRVGEAYDAFCLLDLRGEAPSVTEGWPRRARAQNAISNLQETGRLAGFGRTRFALRPASDDLALRVEGSQLVAEAGEARVVVGLDGEVVEGTERVERQDQEKGMPGTITWVVDTVRNLSFVGPEPIAWLESRVFAVKDFFQRAYYGAFGTPDTEERVAEELGVTEEESRRRAEFSITDPEIGWPPASLDPIIDEPARGEGEWIAIVEDPFVQSYPNAPPALYTTYLQVDPERPFTRVYLAVWDPRAVQLRMMSGTREPESATGETARGMVPRNPETLRRVIAGFNGGFQSLHGEFGMMSEGRVYLPPKPWAATVAVHRDGRVSMGSWRGPPEGVRHYAERWAVRQIPDDMVEYRQNLTSVVEGDRWNPWRRWYWGAAPQGDQEQVFIDRSGLCLTEEGFLIYFWGKSMGAEELGKAMLAGRCMRGLHLDMNQRHTAFELYRAFPRADPIEELGRRLDGDMEFEINVPYAREWRVRGRKLVRSMTPMTFPRYIRRDPRDFFYLTLKPVLPGPHLREGEEGEGVFVTSGLPHAGWTHAFARTWLGGAEDARTWLVRIDASRALPQPLAGEEETEVLAYLTNATSTEGPRHLVMEPQLIGQRYRIVSEVPEGATQVLSGTPVTATSQAAIGVDQDGFWVYAEAAGDPTSLVERLQTAGVDEAIELPENVRLAFVTEEIMAGPDGYEREVDALAALGLLANSRPSTEVLFPNVEPRPYMYWGPMQDSRVRYFRGEGPRRFTGPDAGAP
ncbi:MAG: hypothetical protein AAGE52_04840 [Myxococcota bacterium]